MSIQELEREREIILSEILSLFDKNITENKQIAAFLTKELQETVTQTDMSGYAADIGECLSKAIESTFMNMSDLDNIPYRMADATISPAIREAYRRIMKKAASVQKTIDEKNGVGLNSVTPEYAKERVHDLIWTHTRIKDGKIPTKEEQLSKIKEPVVTCCQSFYDDFIKRNAKFRCDAGKTEYIIRTSTAKCCKWCTSIAGKYNYEDVSDTGNDVYRRHQRCRCTVIFADGTGKRQDVHSKKEWMADPETLEERKTTGLEEPPAEVLEARKTAGLEAGSPELLQARRTVGLKETSPAVLEMRKTAGLDKSYDANIINNILFSKNADPLYDTFGPAKKSHPQILKKLTEMIHNVGGEIIITENTIGYGTAMRGQPGAISITKNASIGAYLHEAQHLFEDYRSGWQSPYILWIESKDERIMREKRAYAIEIAIAEYYGAKNEANELRKNLAKEIKDIIGGKDYQ